MAQRFLSLDEAAQQLGVAKDQLNALREAGNARAFRDGASWKFKESEIERLAAEGIDALIGELRGAVEEGDDDAAAASDVELGEFDLAIDDDQAASGSGSVLLSELELGEDAGEGSSSTIIGKEGEAKPDSDLEISSDIGGGEVSDLALDSGSDLTLDDATSGSSTGDESNVLSPSTGGSGVLDSEPEPAAKFEQLEELDLDLNSSQLSFADDSAAGNVEPPPAGQGEAPKPPPRAESSIKLATDEDDEVVLGEGSSGDITVDSQHSGISLVDSGDTGISLDQAPANLDSPSGGSSVESFDLAGDGSFTLTDQPAAESGSGVQEGSFVLPAADGGSATGSSSQIAFDLDSGISENTPTILGSEPSLGSALDMGGGEPAAPMLEEEPAAAGLEAVAPTGAVTVSAAVREAQYTGWNIAFLSLCSIMLLLSGAMMFDLLRNMWSWNEPYSLNSGIMDAILNALF